MKRMVTDQEVKDICKISNGSGNIKVYNEGIQVDTNGDVTIGRDLYVEDEMVIDSLQKIVDANGYPLFPDHTGQLNRFLHVGSSGLNWKDVILVPMLPTSGTYVLKCIDGVIQWVEEQ